MPSAPQLSSDVATKPEWLHISDPCWWSAFRFEWRGPVHVFALTGEVMQPPAMVADRVGDEDSLLRVAAKGCFWTFPKVALSGIARWLQLADLSGLSLGEFQKVIKHVIPEAKDAESAGILRQRLVVRDDFAEFLQSDEVKDILSKDDIVELDRAACQAGVELDQSASVKVVVQKLRVSSAAGSSAKGSGKGRGKAKPRANSIFGQRQYPKQMLRPADAWSEAQVNDLMPPGARVLLDNNNAKWLLSMWGERRSPSFGLYGFNESAIACLKLAWTTWVDTGRGQACPMSDLFG